MLRAGDNVGYFFFSIFFFFFFFCFAIAMFDLVQDVEAIFPSLTANSIWKCNLQFHGHHSYLRKDFQMLLTVNIGHVQPPHRALGQIYLHLFVTALMMIEIATQSYLLSTPSENLLNRVDRIQHLL